MEQQLTERILDKLDDIVKDISDLKNQYGTDYALVKADNAILKETVNRLEANVKRLEDVQKELVESFKIKDGTIIKVTMIVCATVVAVFQGGSPLLASLMKALGF